jgi:hypothetical protein
MAVSLPYPGHRSLVWSIVPGQPFAPNPGPDWLNPIVEMTNRQLSATSPVRVATRTTQGRALHLNICPTCGLEHPDATARHSERTLAHPDILLSDLPTPKRDSAEWQFVYQWWLKTAADPLRVTRLAALHA